MASTATGIFQYSDEDELVEGSILAHGSTPQEAKANAEKEMARIGQTLPAFSVTEVLPGNPFGL